MIAGSTLTAMSTSPPPEIPVSAFRNASTCSGLSGSATVTCARVTPFRASFEQIEIADHVENREEPALGRDELDEFGGDSADLGLGEKGIERLNLLFGGEDRAFDETLQIRA